ncbi:transcriptional regulator CtsR [Thermosyntropha lipolytica DSM 11003]|uniref:Transcriptional regulator CtsR n=1 Tax=Thermosyntropha lipolytica DSM 11003 TaxID=1123382 RepID=A0A1M5NSN8_9FIRM|nr:CtsR family transcriptional regulator [Thermosyntropha lipolytica]SHG92478.1 transcriptional regulator CtsR [Thermosyntropha lipolytica DSM 11003]
MKKSLADKIEEYLKVLIERSENRQVEIQRSELAETFDCVPSQVTYVLSTRFTEETGYLTESRRGGKGYVKITRLDDSDLKSDTFRRELISFIDEMRDKKNISSKEAEMLKFLTNYAFQGFAVEEKNRIFKALKKALENYLL